MKPAAPDNPESSNRSGASPGFDFDSLTINMFPRLARLRAELLNARPALCIERARLFTEYYRREGFDEARPLPRQARALAYTLDNLPTPVFDDELIAGSTTCHRLGVPLFPEFTAMTILPELPTIANRDMDPVSITDREADVLANEIFPFWRDRNVHEYVRREGENPLCLRIFERLVFFIVSKSNGISHIIPDYPAVVARGLNDIIREAAELERKAGGGDSEAAEFFLAARESLEAVVRFAGRYAAACRAAAAGEPRVPRSGEDRTCSRAPRSGEDRTCSRVPRSGEDRTCSRVPRSGEDRTCSDPARAEELLEMAAILDRVPARPAETFHEALQAVWITQVALHQENTNAALSFGRLDQFLYPAFKRDVESGNLSAERACELLGSFFIKMGDHTILQPRAGKKLLGGASTNQAVTIGGVKPDGTDAVNELTFLILKTAEMLALREPNVGARWHAGSPPEYRRALMKSIYRTGAAPALYNDAEVVAALTENGVALEDARDYGLIGCVETTSAGRTMGMTGAILLNLAAVLELAITGGIHPLSGMRIGPATAALADLKTYDEFYDAFRQQLDFMAALAVDGNNRFAEAHAALHPTPLLSALIQGTFESGKDVTRGGAKYNSSGVAVVGLADTADSLSALKKLVFEEQMISPAELRNSGNMTGIFGGHDRNFVWGHDPGLNVESGSCPQNSGSCPQNSPQNSRILPAELAEALRKNFAGREKIRAMLMRRAPKYGTDDPAADAAAADLVKLIGNTFARHPNPRGGRYHVGYWSITMHAGVFAYVGALPNGRLAGTPLASGATPVSGAAIKGPTASLASTAKLPSALIANSMANNHKFSRNMFSQPGKLELFEKLVDGYFRMGGMQVQFNIHNKETLLEAQKNPEEYRDLLVRVSGYSAYFSDLNRATQDEIIARTEDEI